MIAKLDDFKNGWHGLSIGLSEQDIDGLIERLLRLKSGRSEHFHCRSDFEGEPGLGNIEFFRLNGETEQPHNLSLE